MKHSIKLMITIFFINMAISSCSKNDEGSGDSELNFKGTSLSKVTSEAKTTAALSQTYPQAEKEILETFEAIAQSLKDGDIDQLISFHGYSTKFTEFKNGELRNGPEANESYEHSVFGAVTEVIKFEALDLKIAVYYGNVANVTFHSNFHLKFGDDLVIVNDQESLLFVKIKGEWKIVAEHHSPLNK